MSQSHLPINYKTDTSTLKQVMFPSLLFYYNAFKTCYFADKVAKKNMYTTQRWVDDSLAILHAVEASGGQIYVEGMDSFIQTDKACVFVANHMSTLETFILPALIQPQKDVTFIVKSSLVNYPFFGSVMRARDPILVDRVNPREDFTKCMTEGVKLLNEGNSLIVFPQGTRKKDFNEEDFNSLGAKLAKKAGAYLVPVALKTDFWGIGKIIKDFGKVDIDKVAHFAFGEAMKIEGNGKEEHQACLDFISSNLAKWKAEEKA